MARSFFDARKDSAVNAMEHSAAGLRLMAVHAHPDDEASKGAATMAKYAAQGARVLVVTMTGGERGDVLNPGVVLEEGADLVDVRRLEMEAAAAALGVEHRWAGFVDSGYPQGDPPPPLPEGCFASLDPGVAARTLAAIIREFRPHVLTTYDPDGGYPHPDHLQTHHVSIEAVFQAGDPDAVLGGAGSVSGGAAWAVPKVYYDRAFSRERILALHAAAESAGEDSPFAEWLARESTRVHRAAPVTTRVEAGDYFPRRDAALRAHATQVDPAGWFFAAPRDLEREVWPWEEFELAHSTVPVTFPEDDLFAGLR